MKDLTVMLGVFQRPIIGGFHCSFLLRICFYLYLSLYLSLYLNFIIYSPSVLWAYLSIIFPGFELNT